MLERDSLNRSSVLVVLEVRRQRAVVGRRRRQRGVVAHTANDAGTGDERRMDTANANADLVAKVERVLLRWIDYIIIQTRHRLKNSADL